MARSETKTFGFSTKSVIISLSNFTTPNELGSSICFTHIVPSKDLFILKSDLNKVSAKAITQLPVIIFSAHKTACAVPKGLS